jgi:hypothetical protein
MPAKVQRERPNKSRDGRTKIVRRYRSAPEKGTPGGRQANVTCALEFERRTTQTTPNIGFTRKPATDEPRRCQRTRDASNDQCGEQAVCVCWCTPQGPNDVLRGGYAVTQTKNIRGAARTGA